MGNTKVNFLSKLAPLAGAFGQKLYNVLWTAASEEDWEFVQDLLGDFIERGGYSISIDHLYSLIPGREVEV